MSQLFCIKRDDANVTEYVRQLRNDKETSDVTLVGNDGGSVQAHRNVLILNSDYIKEMLRRNPSPSPLIRIPDVNSKVLYTILDFIYYGKIVLNIEDMEKFIKHSKLLKVKGMFNDTYTVDIQSNEKEDDQSLNDSKIFLEETVSSKKKEVTLGEKYFGDDTLIDIKIDGKLRDSVPYVHSLHNVKEDFCLVRERKIFPTNMLSSSGKPPPIVYLKGKETSKDQLKYYLMKLARKQRDGKFRCSVCKHVANTACHIREHIEQHIEDLFYKCRLCSRMSKGSNGHRTHFNQGKCVKEFKKPAA